jgi:kynureninase
MPSRDDALAYDASDPLAGAAAEFFIADPDLIYLDGNSLGRLPVRTADAVNQVVQDGWGAGLVGSWHQWLDLGQQTGERLAPLIGAAEGEVALCDQTSVNLYKLAAGALDGTGRTVIVTDDSNFPSDRYVLAEVARRAKGTVRTVSGDPVDGPSADDIARSLDADVGLVSLSHVAYRSGALADMESITAAAHEAGALTLWDLSHSAGALEVELNRCNADLAVGCTYKYLNGGPGSPAFLYVRTDLHDQLAQPIHGWFGHDTQFTFSPSYEAATDIRRFLVGTPSVLSMVGANQGIELCAEIGIEALRRKSCDLTDLLVDLFDARLTEYGFELGSPRSAEHRGSHVILVHEEGYRITQALIAAGVIPDYRDPGAIRFGIAPSYTSATHVWDAVERLVSIMQNQDHLKQSPAQARVT